MTRIQPLQDPRVSLQQAGLWPPYQNPSLYYTLSVSSLPPSKGQEPKITLWDDLEIWQSMSLCEFILQTFPEYDCWVLSLPLPYYISKPSGSG